jgi:cellulose synthase (UDP-forming)
LSRERRRQLRLSLLPWLVCLTLFVVWWSNPVHHIQVLGTLIGTAICFFEVLMPGYFYYFLGRMQVVNPAIEPDPSWRLAIVVTKSPSEPWQVVLPTRGLSEAVASDLREALVRPGT